jgi:hypothetical protein
MSKTPDNSGTLAGLDPEKVAFDPKRFNEDFNRLVERESGERGERERAMLRAPVTNHQEAMKMPPGRHILDMSIGELLLDMRSGLGLAVADVASGNVGGALARDGTLLHLGIISISLAILLLIVAR